MKRLLAILSIVGLGMACITSCGKPQKIRIGYQKTEIYQHFFTAIEKGYFKSEGLEVEPIEFASANLMAEALIAGRIDGTATSAFPVIFSVEQNNPGQFKIYLVNAVTETSFPDYILVKKGSELENLSDLKGKKIGTYPGSTLLTYTKLILGHFMDPEEDITIVQLKPDLQIQALESGQVDAILALEPIASVVLEQGVAQVLEEAPLAKYVMNPLPGSGSTFSPKFIEDNPRAVKKVIKAMNRAADFLRDSNNTAEAQEILAKWTGMDEEVIERLRPLTYWKLEEIDREAVQNLADVLFEEGVLEKRTETSTLYYGE